MLKQFRHMKDEHRHIEDTTPAELDVYLLVVRVRQTNGEKYEPSTLRGIISSTDRLFGLNVQLLEYKKTVISYRLHNDK